MPELKIALLHERVNVNQLEMIKKEMAVLGRPVIRAVWTDTYGMWLALEGTHRLRAAYEMSLLPLVYEVAYQPDVTLSSLGLDCESDTTTLEDVLNSCYRATVLHFKL
ncbi:MAG TPA: hypothetical protein VE954_40140 [Oligoflexus sp.]|uniref:hypothetical protein n=1 Tax=Oligoflexus sp. TaxID=1971216 RepID=UPI002D55D544|nr:hypothetical protein [Oligoflexus sp.]HYX39353.1 hypothetical protein [Oligoflexus sp.]